MKSTKRRTEAALLVALVGLCASITSFTSSASAQTYVFGRAPVPSAGAANSVVTADFNRDGKPDLAGGGFILLGQPDGTFAPAPGSAAGDLGGTLLVADFNGDGIPDLAVAGYSSVSVLLGNGDGTFQTAIVTPTRAPALGMVAGDFNGDGKQDLVYIQNTGTYGGAFYDVLIGNGDGTFQPDVEYSLGAHPSRQVISGDFNNDGKLDLVVDGAAILLGNGDGTFQPPQPLGVKGPVVDGIQITTSAAAGDFNADGKLDLAFDLDNGEVAILLGNGDGTFEAPAMYGAGFAGLNGLTSGFILVTSLRADGRLDVVVGDPTGFSVLLGNRDGTFEPSQDYGPFTSGENAGAIAMAAADFNGDGKPDLALAFDGLTIILDNGDGTFPPGAKAVPAVGPNSLSPSSVLVGDFDNDGNPDVGGCGGVALGNGDGTFQPVKQVLPCPGQVAGGDFNNDGKLDMAFALSSANAISVYLGNGDGTLQGPGNFATGPAPIGIATGDFNGDGNLDLATTNSMNNTVSILLGKGEGTFSTHVEYGTGLNPNSVAVGDFNGDGKLDLAVGNSGASTVSILLGNGDGTFRPHVDYAVGGGPNALFVGDFNGDGKIDLAAIDAAVSLSILLGNGDGTFQPHKDVLSEGPLVFSAPTDMGGNGKLDFAALGYGCCPSILWGNGDGTFQLPVATPPAGSGVPVLGDFNNKGDGGVDLVMAGSLSGILLNVPVIALHPPVVTFGEQAVGVTSAPQTLLVSNPGSMPLKISSITASADFAIATSSCGSVLAVGASCKVGVTFTPSTTGRIGGTITLADAAHSSPQIIALVGTGVNEPLVSLSPASLNFGSQIVGTTSAAQKVTLSNTGSAALTLLTISTSLTSFSQTNNCGAGLAVGASCTISVTFTPSSVGTLAGSLVITDNAGDSPQTVALTGSGMAPIVSLSATSLTFGSQILTTTSGAQAVTLNNTGNAALTITSVAITGSNASDFAQTNNCASSLNAGASCTVSVTFKPTGANTRTAALSVTDNALGSPQSVALTGRGADFALSYFSGGATITAGETASYTLKISPQGGFNQAVALACIGAPQAATCSLSSSSVTLNGSNATSVTVTVATTARSGMMPDARPAPPWWRVGAYGHTPLLVLWLLALVAVAALYERRISSPVIDRRYRGDRRYSRRAGWKLAPPIVFGATLFLVLLWTACGGGGGVTHNPGTPAGSYTLTVTATYTSGSTTLQHTQTLPLTVN